MSRLYIGIDGGGTRTRAVLAGSDLEERGRGASGPANVATRPLPRVLETLEEAITDALASAGARAEDLSAVSCGLAGVESSGSSGRLFAALEERWGKGRVLVTTDARAALAGAADGDVDEPGVVLIAGTGAIAFGRGRDGQEARAGGWGPVIGDEGSGYAMARQALAAVVRDLDGRGPKTSMTDLLFTAEGTRSATELVQKIHRSDGGAGDVAAYFPVVLAAARLGDAEAIRILAEAGSELALAATTVVRKLGLESAAFKVSTVGGVFSAGELLLGPLREGLRRVAPRALLGPPAHSPEIGAIRLVLTREAA
jgi:N-acetylglucosamine kinase-like BadF-type ATPase